MKTLIVTSEVTFVPENYDQLIVGLADHPSVIGLLVLENWELSLLGKAIGLMALGAPRVGKQLLKNKYGKSRKRRETAYKKLGKKLWYLETINCPEAEALVKQEGVDLILNARTRYIYKAPILRAPKLGCINIHHGILPDQRGTMCDLWALYNGTNAGFSVHAMNEKIDDGPILEVCQVDPGNEKDFLHYLDKAAKLECEVLKQQLNKISESGTLEGCPNQCDPTIVHTKNPDRSQIKEMKRKGIKL